MDQHNATPDTQERSSVARRTVLKGAAWSVPVVAVVGATPAFAATNTAFSFTSPTPAVINATNSTSNLTASGTGPDGAIITVTLGTWSETTTVVAGEWTKVIPAANVHQGLNVEVSASSSKGGSATKTYTKDVTAPALTHTATDTAKDKKSGTLSGAYGMLNTPTADGVVSVSFTSPESFSHTLTQTAGTWNLSWTWTNNGNGVHKVITIEQSDGAGNKTTLTYRIA